MPWTLSPWRRRRSRARWEAGLAWFRLRYDEAAGPTRCLQLLSRPAACGRLALSFQPGVPVATLRVGLPVVQAPLLSRMAADFGFALSPVPAEATGMAEASLRPAASLPWDRPFLAHLVDEGLFVRVAADEPMGSVREGRDEESRPTWFLPAPPPPGLALTPAWPDPAPPESLVTKAGDPNGWPLGWTARGTPLGAGGRINLYGQSGAVADWLAPLILQLLERDPAGLVLLDGAGNLGPRLKRQAAVTRLLGQGVTYLDGDGVSAGMGFNPLAAVPRETAPAQLGRWETWFAGMGVHPQGLALLVEAQAAGVRELPALENWLRGAERRSQATATAGLRLALRRLAADRALAEWLAWPADTFAGLRDGALFLVLRARKDDGSVWSRRQLLRAALLAALALPEARLICHGFPWEQGDAALLAGGARWLVSNGPLLGGSTVVLTAAMPPAQAGLAARFLDDDPRWREQLTLLRPGQGLVVAGEAIVPAARRRPGGDRDGGDDA